MLVLLSTLCLGWSFSSKQKTEEGCVCRMCLGGSSWRCGPGFLLLTRDVRAEAHVPWDSGPGPGSRRTETWGEYRLKMTQICRAPSFPPVSQTHAPSPEGFPSPSVGCCPWGRGDQLRGPGLGVPRAPGGAVVMAAAAWAAPRRVEGGSPGLGVSWRRLFASGRGDCQCSAPQPASLSLASINYGLCSRHPSSGREGSARTGRCLISGTLP